MREVKIDRLDEFEIIDDILQVVGGSFCTKSVKQHYCFKAGNAGQLNDLRHRRGIRRADQRIDVNVIASLASAILIRRSLALWKP